MTLLEPTPEAELAIADAAAELFDAIGEPVWDFTVSGWYAGATAHHRIHILPYIVNHRLVLTPKRDLRGYDAAWCFDTDHEGRGYEIAWAAVQAWDLATMPEPPGYRKAIGWTIPVGHPERVLVLP